MKKNGLFAYICSNKWIKTQYGKNLRNLVLNYVIKNYDDYTGKKIFQDATVDVSTIIVKKDAPLNNKIKVNDEYSVNQTNLTKENFSFEKEEIFNLKQKIHDEGIELKKLDVEINRGILTGLNEVFIINKEKYDSFIVEDFKTKNIIEPLLRGRDIWKHKFYFNDLYLINSYDGLNIEDEYPVIYNYFLEHDVKVKKRGDKGKFWYNLRPCAYIDDFKKPKIVYSTISTEPCFVFDDEGYYLNNSAYIMTSDTIDLKYLNALLTSNVLYYYFKGLGTDYGGKASPYRKIYIEQLPIVTKNNEITSQIIENMDKLLLTNKKYVKEILNFHKWLQGEYNIDKLSQKLEKYYELSFDEFLEEVRKKKVDTKKRALRENLEDEFNNSLSIIKPLQNEIQELEDDINQKVYKLYDLTDDEIKIIEDSLNE